VNPSRESVVIRLLTGVVFVKHACCDINAACSKRVPAHAKENVFLNQCQGMGGVLIPACR
jgi:hypothetical protein